jgi:Arc/MetJ-type ribon-helix-helix transcriptional regulator
MDEKRKSLSEHIRSAVRKMMERRGFLRDDSPEDDDGDVLVGAPIRPRPHLNSGAVALELPDDPEY